LNGVSVARRNRVKPPADRRACSIDVLDQGGGELEGASVRRLADVAAGG
jgi:hypothetical protein